MEKRRTNRQKRWKRFQSDNWCQNLTLNPDLMETKATDSRELYKTKAKKSRDSLFRISFCENVLMFRIVCGPTKQNI